MRHFVSWSSGRISLTLQRPNSVDRRCLSSISNARISNGAHSKLAHVNYKLSVSHTRALSTTNLKHKTEVFGGVVNGYGDEIIGDSILQDAAKFVTEQASSPIAESTLSQLGLCNFTPPGFVQKVFEVLHSNIGLPWWASIIAVTITMRCCLFPLFVQSQKASAAMSKAYPTISRSQKKIEVAIKSGDSDQIKAAISENDAVSRDLGIDRMATMKPILGQSVVAASMFFGLKNMCEFPVPSMESGGILWFVDLTTHDPLYALPLITCTTLFISIRFGGESGMSAEQMGNVMKIVMYGIPIISLPVMSFFPAALNVYWLTSNLIGIGQAKLLKKPAVRKYFNIPLIDENVAQRVTMEDMNMGAINKVMADKMKERMKLRRERDNLHVQKKFDQSVKDYEKDRKQKN